MFKWLRQKTLTQESTQDNKNFIPIGQKKILIVEDNELNAKLFTDLLNAHGYDTRQTGEGLKALELAREFKPDLILMDIQLPEVSGLEVTKWIKEDATLKDIPVIAVSAFAMKGDEKGIVAAGCQAYIAKPITVTTFLETIRKVLAGIRIKRVNLPSRKTAKRDNGSVKKSANKIIDDEAREKRNAYQRKYRARKKNNIRCFRLNNEQLELIASLRAEGMSFQKISETTGLGKSKLIGELDKMGRTRRYKCGEVTQTRKKSPLQSDTSQIVGKTVIGSEGTPLTIADLPDPDIARWTLRRKLMVVSAVNQGLLSREDAIERYNFLEGEFESWMRDVRQNLAS